MRLRHAKVTHLHIILTILILLTVIPGIRNRFQFTDTCTIYISTLFAVNI
jgi:hypothetical protein